MGTENFFWLMQQYLRRMSGSGLMMMGKPAVI